MNTDSDDYCIVCHEKNIYKLQYFHCSVYHNLCYICLCKNLSSRLECSDKCPLCKAPIINECKNPNTLTFNEIVNLDVSKIILRNIYIRQSYELRPNLTKADITYDNKTISLYMDNGNLAMYNDMYIGVNGFFYSFDIKYQQYYLSISKGRYQFWDINKIYRLI